MQEESSKEGSEGLLISNAQAPRRNKYIFITVMGAFSVVLLVGGALALQDYLANTKQIEETPVPQEVAVTTDFAPKGYLVFNFATGENKAKELYTYNTENGDLYQSPLNLFWPAESYDGQIAIGSKSFMDGKTILDGIFKLQNSEETLVYATGTAKSLLANPKISGSGTKYTFSVSPDLDKMETYEQRYLPSEWKLYYGEIDGSEPQHIANGPSGVFSPDETKLLYLADDGFHMYDLQTGADVAIPELAQEQKLTYFMVDVSHDGKTLALTSSPTAQVKIFNILSWEPFAIELEYELPVLGYWPAISPDGKYFAFMKFDWVDGHPGNRRISIMDLETGETDNIEGLESFTENDFYLSDWIN